MPALAARLARGGGTLVDAARAVADVGTRAPADQPVFATLSGGLGRLPRQLVASGRFAVRTGVTVRTITRTATGFALDCGPVRSPELVEADAVIVATPAAKTARLLAEVAPARQGSDAVVAEVARHSGGAGRAACVGRPRGRDRRPAAG
jgi:oxygen-dependent protoporphyrinogen oxidase